MSLYFLELTDLFKPAKVGFQCYDRTLSMPYVETSEELIPLLMLLSLAFAAPAASVVAGGGGAGCGPLARALLSTSMCPQIMVGEGHAGHLSTVPAVGRAGAWAGLRAASTPVAATSSFLGGQCAL